MLTIFPSGEVVSRASRNRRTEAIDASSNTEGYHLDWMFTKHDLGKELYWGREFSLCERTGSKCEDMSKILKNTLKLQKALRDMHRNLIESISNESGKASDLYIPTKYEELESILKISRIMLQIK
ncbi:20214_t:CDS:2, partial [Funneliformis geosporum]